MTERPALDGLFHVAVKVKDLERSLAFWRDVVGLRVEWRPDAENAYLTSGRDNLALHAAPPGELPDGRLDHLGVVLPTPEAVDAWAAFLAAKGTKIERPPRTHRDGARSFYVRDPDGTLVQFIFHPPISSGSPGE
jgi:catechol 2,3-dioxygenase-like lactoylglutathione lyase family enzyme